MQNTEKAKKLELPGVPETIATSQDYKPTKFKFYHGRKGIINYLSSVQSCSLNSGGKLQKTQEVNNSQVSGSP